MVTENVNFTVEQMDQKSLPDFTNLLKSYFEELDIVPEFYRHDQDITAPHISYAAPRGGIWLARDKETGNAIGLAAVRPIAKRTCELKRMYVRPDYRRRGIGQDLLNHIMDFSKKQEYMELLLSVSPDQKAALAVCEKNGFTYCARYNDDNRAGLFLSYNFPTDF